MRCKFRTKQECPYYNTILNLPTDIKCFVKELAEKQ